MLRIVIFISLSTLLFACKEEIQFQSCSFHPKLVGEWESIYSDTKNTITIEENGLIVTKFGVERKLKRQAIKCSLFTYQNINYAHYDSEKEAVASFRLNATMDTILTGTGAQDLSKDTVLYTQMRFIKVK